MIHNKKKTKEFSTMFVRFDDSLIAMDEIYCEALLHAINVEQFSF